MSLFTPIPGLIGGSLVGLGASTLLLMNGDVMGASGITTSVVLQPRSTWKSQPWKYVFTASFIVAANLYNRFVDPDSILDTGATRSLTTIGYIFAGLLVGFGTKLGNGCTSGHGICGLARFSKRSFAAVGTFMAVASATATLLAQEAVSSVLPFLYQDAGPTPTSSVGAAVLVVASTCVALYSLRKNHTIKTAGAALGGAFFAIGLVVGKMVIPSKVNGFLDLSGFSKGTYDPSLACVMGSGVVMSLVGYQLKSRSTACTTPVCAPEYNVPTSGAIDYQLMLGAAIFGAGWGLGSACPGPALYIAAVGSTPFLFAWLPAFFIGSHLAEEYKSSLSAKNTKSASKSA